MSKSTFATTSFEAKGYAIIDQQHVTFLPSDTPTNSDAIVLHSGKKILINNVSNDMTSVNLSINTQKEKIKEFNASINKKLKPKE